MSKYERIIKQQRKHLNRISVKNAKRVSKIYEKSIEELVKSNLEDEKEIKEQLELLQARLRYNISKVTKEAVDETIKVSFTTNSLYLEQILTDANSLVGISNTGGLYNKIHEDVILAIMSGSLYKDNTSLSKRVWNIANGNGQDIQSIVAKGMLEKKSAIELARDIEEFIKPAAKRASDWRKVYPHLANKSPVDYNAMRFARTTINHTYQTTTIHTARSNPYTQYIKWLTSNAHNTCEICKEREETDHIGKGEGVYPVDEVPLDHPNGLCTIIPVVPDLTEAAGEINEWLKGNDNLELDKWYEEYGEYYSVNGKVIVGGD